MKLEGIKQSFALLFIDQKKKKSQKVYAKNKKKKKVKTSNKCDLRNLGLLHSGVCRRHVCLSTMCGQQNHVACY